MIPVNLSEPCYFEKGLQILEELDHGLVRSKCIVRKIITGIVVLITLIASAATSALALAKEVQTSSYLNGKCSQCHEYTRRFG